MQAAQHAVLRDEKDWRTVYCARQTADRDMSKHKELQTKYDILFKSRNEDAISIERLRKQRDRVKDKLNKMLTKLEEARGVSR